MNGDRRAEREAQCRAAVVVIDEEKDGAARFARLAPAEEALLPRILTSFARGDKWKRLSRCQKCR